MSNTITQIKIGTRGSKLALKQTKIVLEKFKKLPQIKNNFNFKIIKIKTEGDIKKKQILKSGYKGFFTKKIDELLLKEKIDLAVHSAKDLPSKIDKNIIISAFLKREDPRDVLFSKKNEIFNHLPKNVIIGTSSIRRKKQIQNIRPDLNVKYMRGNIETRLKKFKKNKYYAIILALAGIKRLNISYEKKNILDILNFIPSGGQGAIAVTVLKKNNIINNLTKKISDKKTAMEVKTERQFLKEINADCDSPVGAYAKVVKKYINFSVTVPNKNESGMFFFKSIGKFDRPEILGNQTANILKKKFGNNFLKINNYQKKYSLLLTRPEKQFDEFKSNKDFKFINCPLLKIKALKLNKYKIEQMKKSDVIIFTSSNAVFYTKKYLKLFRNKIICVGKDTKKTCLKNNIKNVVSADGNVFDLIKLIKKKIKNKSEKLLYISAKETAVNLTSILKSNKFNIKKLTVYESKKIKIINKSILDLIKSNQLNFVSFFSKKTAQAFNELTTKYKLQKHLRNISCVSLSKEIEKLLKKNNFKKYYLCSNPDRESFLKLLKFINQNMI